MAIITETTRELHRQFLLAHTANETIQADTTEVDNFLSTEKGQSARKIAKLGGLTEDKPDTYEDDSIFAVFKLFALLAVIMIPVGSVSAGAVMGVPLGAVPIMVLFALFLHRLEKTHDTYRNILVAAQQRRQAAQQRVDDLDTKAQNAVLADIQAAGYTVISTNPDDYTYITDRGVLALRIDKNNDLQIVKNGTVVTENYTHLLEDPEPVTARTMAGVETVLRSPKFWGHNV